MKKTNKNIIDKSSPETMLCALAMSLFLALGVVVSCFIWRSFAGESDNAELTRLFYSHSQQSFLEILICCSAVNCAYLLFIAVLGNFTAGFILIPALLFLRGMGMTFVVCSVLSSAPDNQKILLACLLGGSYLIACAAMIALAACCERLSASLLSGVLCNKISINKKGAGAILFLICVLAELSAACLRAVVCFII